ncbi:MAG: hypothetical protein MUF52_13825 [Syntrophobacteraceae bacterium]|jgi:hypothetical protein|nr:hypothetical protein [Syntrophobacteraceae bacterium]
MSVQSDPEVLAFSAEVIEKWGGVVEQRDGRLHALLSRDLAGELQVSEEPELGASDAPLLYGSPLLDRLIGLATRDIPVAYGQITVPYLKKAGFEQLIGRDITFADGQVRVVARAETRSTYMVLMCCYTAMSDERREGLVEVGVQEASGALAPGLVEHWRGTRPEFYREGGTPPHFPDGVEAAVSAGMREAEVLLREELSDFLASMRRRLRRDVRNTREYYGALQGEMEASLSHPTLTEPQREDRKAKIRDLPLEMERKVGDLEQKYRVRVTISACAAVRLLVDVVQVMVELRYRKASRSLGLIWSPVTRRIEPLLCEQCRQTTASIHPTGRDAGIRLLCHACARK